MAAERTNNSVRGIGGVIMVLGMVAAIFGIGNHLNQRMNYMAEGAKLNIARVEQHQIAHGKEFELSKVRRKVTDDINAEHSTEDSAKFARLRAEVNFLKEARKDQYIEIHILQKRISELEKHTCPITKGH